MLYNVDHAFDPSGEDAKYARDGLRARPSELSVERLAD